jgi:hypothetical protein
MRRGETEASHRHIRIREIRPPWPAPAPPIALAPSPRGLVGLVVPGGGRHTRAVYD